MVTPARLPIFPRTLPRLLAAGLLTAVCAAAPPLRAEPVEGDGLRADAAWPRWQGRIGLAEPAWGEPLRRPLPSFALLGDYYLMQQGGAQPGRYSGGLRATGGLLVGAHSQNWAGLPAPGLSLPRSGPAAAPRGLRPPSPTEGAAEVDDWPASRPYIGIGYTGLRALQEGGWGFSADLGMVALRPRSAVRFGQQGMGELLRDLQLSPVLQLGVSYSF